MGRFCVTPRMNKPKRVLEINKDSPINTQSANIKITRRFQGMVRPFIKTMEPLIQLGLAMATFCAPNTDLMVWIKMRLAPQVANRVSKGRPYKCLKTDHSSKAPTHAADKNDAGIATGKYQFMASGSQIENTFWVTYVA